MHAYPSFDLNLLRALDALLAERSVTRAAARTGVTQPAMSRSLARLREIFDDRLLVRSRVGMEPTARGLTLVDPVRRVLEGISDVVEVGAEFVPARSQRSFTVAAADLLEYLLLPPLMARFATAAPTIDLAFRRASSDLAAALEGRELDLAIDVTPTKSAASSLSMRKLFDEQFACVVRRDHPQVKRRLTLSQFVALPHLLIAPRERAGGIVDQALGQRGMRRRVALRVPNFLVAPEVLVKTDLIATLPRRAARRFAAQHPLRVLQPPLPLPSYSMSLLWHARDDRDPAHTWLRREIAAITRAAI